eukprot:TRINITY_DN18583_c0_g1_i1.p1 TRINITY_DN18583_c0_g1~~TRINITY_DN18583_c0_g1_i1.p1  ORF type:complete len:713 (-),score=216.99 TRINITY_DN18583_c0_g1_i1:59-2197(-)
MPGATTSKPESLAGTAKSSPVKKKLGYEAAGDYEGYYGAEAEWDGWEEKWPAHGGAPHPAGAWDWGYYGEDGFESVEVDLYKMIFSLDAALDPQDLYEGFDFDDRSMVFVLEAEDIEQAPAAWKSRPLKIHPEPPPLKKTDSTGGAATPIGSPKKGGSVNASGVATPTGKDTNGLPASFVTQSGTPVRLGSTDALLEENARTPKAAAAQVGSPVAGSQSPKIVINQSQLEHLKQKMEALKQKRNMSSPGPSPGGVAISPFAMGLTAAEDSKLSAVMSQESLKTLKATQPEQVCVSNCAGGHGLKKFPTPEEGWWCSTCKKVHVKGTIFWGCRECDHDECETCALLPLFKRNGKAAVAAKVPTPTAPPPAVLPPPPPQEDASSQSGSQTSAEAPPQQRSSQVVQKKASKEKIKDKKKPKKKEQQDSPKKSRKEETKRKPSQKDVKDVKKDTRKDSSRKQSSKEAPKESKKEAEKTAARRSSTSGAKPSKAADRPQDSDSDESEASRLRRPRHSSEERQKATRERERERPEKQRSAVLKRAASPAESEQTDEDDGEDDDTPQSKRRAGGGSSRKVISTAGSPPGKSGGGRTASLSSAAATLTRRLREDPPRSGTVALRRVSVAAADSSVPPAARAAREAARDAATVGLAPRLSKASSGGGAAILKPPAGDRTPRREEAERAAAQDDKSLQRGPPNKRMRPGGLFGALSGLARRS